MAERIVIDTEPIILSLEPTLDVVAKLALEFVSPIEVREELAEGVHDGRPAIVVDWLRFATLSAGPLRCDDEHRTHIIGVECFEIPHVCAYDGFDLCRRSVAHAKPNHFGWAPVEKAQLPEVGVFR